MSIFTLFKVIHFFLSGLFFSLLPLTMKWYNLPLTIRNLCLSLRGIFWKLDPFDTLSFPLQQLPPHLCRHNLEAQSYKQENYLSLLFRFLVYVLTKLLPQSVRLKRTNFLLTMEPWARKLNFLSLRGFCSGFFVCLFDLHSQNNSTKTG